MDDVELKKLQRAISAELGKMAAADSLTEYHATQERLQHLIGLIENPTQEFNLRNFHWIYPVHSTVRREWN